MSELFTGFNYADLAAGILIAVWTLFGMKKGMSGQVAFFLSGLAVVLSLYFGLAPCLDWLVKEYTMTADLARIVAVMALVSIPLLLVLLVHALAGYVVKVTFTAWMDRACGAIAALFTSCAFIALLFVLLNVLPANIRPASAGKESWIGRQVLRGKTKVFRNLESRMGGTRNVLEQAREQRTSKREKWEE